MNTKSPAQIAYALAILSALSATTGTAAEEWQGDNRFSVDGVVGLNFKASFRNLQAPVVIPDPAAGGQVTRTYDNGFVGVDASDNAGNTTTFWGFDTTRGATSDGLPGGTVVLTSAPQSPSLGATVHADDKPQAGVELGYARRLFRFGKKSKVQFNVGVEGGFSFMDLAIHESATISGNAVTVDTYNLAPGNSVLGSSYTGSFFGPGPLLGSIPGRSYLPGTALVENRLDGHLLGFKLGPVLELLVGNRVAFTVSGGFSAVAVDATYNNTEVFMGTRSTDSADLNEWGLGGYLKGGIIVRLNPHWLVQAGVQYQNVGLFSATAANHNAQLDLRDALLISFGLGYSF
jgi:hypothetical protein